MGGVDVFWRFIFNIKDFGALGDSSTMDMMLLLAKPQTAVGYDKQGDFIMDEDGRLERKGGNQTAYAYAGALITHPKIFGEVEEEAWDMNVLFDKAISEGRLFGSVLNGMWLHVGTPEAIIEAEDAIKKGGGL